MKGYKVYDFGLGEYNTYYEGTDYEEAKKAYNENKNKGTWVIWIENDAEGKIIEG